MNNFICGDKMGIESWGVCLTDYKDKKVLEMEVISVLKKIMKKHGVKNKSVIIQRSSFSELSQFMFNMPEGRRTFSLFFDCDNDFKDVGLPGKKITFNIGVHGSYKEIMNEVGAFLEAKYGEVKIDYSDCDDVGFQSLSIVDLNLGSKMVRI